MNELITYEMKQGNCQVRLWYDTTDQKWVATIWLDEAGVGEWWEWLSGTGITTEQALDKLAQHTAREAQP